MEEELQKLELPLVALRGITVLPDMILHFDLNRKPSVEAVQEALKGDERVFLVAQKNPNENELTRDNLYQIGTIAFIKQVTKLPNGVERVLVEGLEKAQMMEMIEHDGVYYSALLEKIEDDEEMDETQETAYRRSLEDVFATYVKFFPKIGKSVGKYFTEPNKLSFLVNQVAINIPLPFEQKQQLLETARLEERCTLLISLLMDEAQIAAVRAQLAIKIKEKIEKNQKEYVLREQLAAIKEELGDKDGLSDMEQYEIDTENLKAPKEVKDKLKKEIKRLKLYGGAGAEGAVERNYIETLLEMPWSKTTKESKDLNKAEDILNRDHYGLEKVKERIMEYLAVRTLTKKGEAPILCLVGPPGTGKTSIAKSIAEALNKKYVRICLGGVHDEAEIRGHRKTYIGAMPGRIAAGIKQAGVSNPLMLLDEIDKVSNDYKGDTSAALLEVLDPEQNAHFRDHYLEVPLDLSEVLFIATANDASAIPRPLLDRMELIEISSYTATEKFHIAKEHLLEKQIEKNGLTKEQLTITDGALKDIIAYYTKEAGVRGLERQLIKLCSKTARELTSGKSNAVKITGQSLEKYLGKRKYRINPANEEDAVGIVRGLAWTSVGGDTLEIEVAIMPGKGNIELTGQLGDVMKESAKTGMSYIRSVADKYKIAPNYFEEHDFHLHIPEGAVPKDGPSAGITMATAVLSAITDTPVSCKVAMTGEITLRGRVLPIGGLKEKMLAAKMAGITTILVPKDNESDVAEIPKEIKNGMDIHYVTKMEEVLALALVKKKKGRKG